MIQLYDGNDQALRSESSQRETAVVKLFLDRFNEH